MRKVQTADKMQTEQTNRDVATPSGAPGDARPGRTFSRRQALGGLSVVAASVGAGAWVIPEILTAKPAAGATMSAPSTSGGSGGGNGGGNGQGVGGGNSQGSPNGPVSSPSTLAATTSAQTSPGSTLALTGVDIQRDAELGAALIAGGWAIHRWASRTPKLATEAPEAGTEADRT